jgi:hypothetical protein
MPARIYFSYEEVSFYSFIWTISFIADDGGGYSC